MIYIDLFGNPPPKELIEEGQELTRQLMAVGPEERAAFIEKNKAYWGKLKSHYSKLSYGKCWYSEAEDLASAYHMDHFRPKNKTKALTVNCDIKTINNKEPYWWLAFNWTNYRFSASIPNTSKSSYFPLQPGSPIAKNETELEQEWPGLLDPTDEYDVSLIAFGIDGKVYPACADMNSWDAKRVSLSVRVYNLDYISLVDKRKEVQQACKTKIEQIKTAQREYAKTHSSAFRSLLKQYISELRKMTKPTSELSSVARNYVRNDPEEFIRNIAV